MTAPHDRPTAEELIEAVREFLEGEVDRATEGRVRFHARVAANALSMVERELSLGPEQQARAATRLASLGFETDADLARAIRDGELDDRYPAVKAALSETVEDKLRVANPRYLDE